MRYAIIRAYYPDATTGILLSPDGQKICLTLERPWNNNKKATNFINNDSSCIPEGIYQVRKYSSAKFSDVWEILNVKDRTKILIHSANFVGQLLGCISVGSKIIENFKYQEVAHPHWITNSGQTLKNLRSILPNEFTLEIKAA